MTDDSVTPEDMDNLDPETPDLEAMDPGNVNVGNTGSAEAPAFSAEALGIVRKMGGSILEAAAATLAVTLNTSIQVSSESEEAYTQFSGYPEPFAGEEKFLILVEYQKTFAGTVGYVLREHDAKILADLMLGGTGEVTPASLSDMQMGAIGEAMSQMMNSAATCMATTLSQVVNVRSPDVIPYDPDFLLAALPGVGEGAFLATRYQFQIESAGASITLLQLIAAPEVQKLVTLIQAMEAANAPVKTPAIADLQDVLSSLQWEAEPSAPMAAVASQARSSETKVETPSATPAGYASQPSASSGFAGPSTGGFYGGPQPQQAASGYQGASNHPHAGGSVTVQSAQFAPFDQSLSAYGDQNRNLELVMDVTLNLTVELGKTNLSIKEVLELTRGSVIELSRVAGEPVDLLANGKLIAKGEVVVIEDNFGIRITTIISPSERLRGL
jgi:flagellar motor switch protein FliN